MVLPENFNGVVELKDLMAHLEILKGDVGEFMKDYIEKIIFIMQNGKSLNSDSKVSLFTERDICLYNPS